MSMETPHYTALDEREEQRLLFETGDDVELEIEAVYEPPTQHFCSSEVEWLEYWSTEAERYWQDGIWLLVDSEGHTHPIPDGVDLEWLGQVSLVSQSPVLWRQRVRAERKAYDRSLPFAKTSRILA